MANNLKTYTSAQAMMQIGDSGGLEGSGYVSIRTYIYSSSVNSNANNTGNWEVGTTHQSYNTAGQLYMNSEDGKTWFISGGIGTTYTVNHLISGHKTLSSTLDRIRIYPNTNSHQTGYWRVGYR